MRSSRRPRALLPLALALTAGALASPAAAERAPTPWPPADGPGDLFVHFGEEHFNDADGKTLLPKVVEDSARYEPALVTMSGDKGEDGEAEQLEGWKEVMHAFDKAGVPYLAAAGNHDRKAPPGAPGGVVGRFYATTPDSFDEYKEVFKDRPYPMGDAEPYRAPGFAPQSRPADDPAGAAATYFADVAGTRWIFLDNSCWGLSSCDPFVARADGSNTTQLEFLRSRAREAKSAGKVVFVVMHMPTRDPRDLSYANPETFNHVMGKGVSPDNDAFERIAAETGVDGVFVGHIKGQFLYKGRGGVPYYIDGGAGGELYIQGPVGIDHGYWHGYRVMRVDGSRIETDAVPIFVENGITVEGPDRVDRADVATFRAFGRQPVFNDPAKVERLELADPDPVPPPERGMFAGALGDVVIYGGPPLLVLVLLLGVTRFRVLERRPRVALGATAGLLVLSGAGAAAVAQQQDVPTRTGKDALPAPARIWTTDNARVLAPVAASQDDPRRDPATQTAHGRFVARCPGTTRVSVTSGWERTTKVVTVPSRAGAITRGVARGERRAPRGRTTTVARIRPAQPAVVRVRVRRGKRVVKTISHGCTGRPVAARWTPSRSAKRGLYDVEVAVFSDRKPLVRRYAVRVP